MARKQKASQEKGRRISVWIPEKDLWLFHVLERRLQDREQKTGNRMSQGDIIREILVKDFKQDLE